MRKRQLNWNDLAALGLIARINKEVLHPLGLAMSRDPATGTSTAIFVAEDGENFGYADGMDNSLDDDATKNRLMTILCPVSTST